MPDFVVHRVMEVLNDLGEPLNGSRILIFGPAHKPNVDDDRELSTYWLMEMLEHHGAVVSYNDPYIPVIRPKREFRQYAGRKSVAISTRFDLFLISTARDEYKRIDLISFSVPIVATRHVARANGAPVYQV